MWSQYFNLTDDRTDRQTDGRTDGQTTYCGITAFCVASGGKALHAFLWKEHSFDDVPITLALGLRSANIKDKFSMIF